MSSPPRQFESAGVFEYTGAMSVRREVLRLITHEYLSESKILPIAQFVCRGWSELRHPLMIAELDRILRMSPISDTQKRSWVEDALSRWIGTLRRVSQLEFVRKQGGFPEYRFSDVCEAAAFNGNLSGLRWASRTWYIDRTRVCERAAEAGSLECLRWAHEYGYTWSRYAEEYRIAALRGHLDCLRYAHENNNNGWGWDWQICACAAEGGHLDCLRYAHENGCKIYHPAVIFQAVRGGNLACFKYIHENGGSWDVRVCSEAAACGSLDYLRYAHENSCEWDVNTCDEAARNGYLDCLRYARENGCPWDADIEKIAREKGYDGP